MLITEALAQGAPAAGGGSFLVQLLPFIMILGIMYFLIIRPQQKRLKDHRDMIATIRRGDTVVTAGGLVGKVSKVIGDGELQVELAEGVRVRVIRSTISEVRTRGDVRDVEARKALAKANDDEPDEADEPADVPAAKPATPVRPAAADAADKDA
ncbi:MULTISPECIES: preprotein translocase subunit YajC [Rhodomicrobium]|uniref:preprotein translocase subunit YajC n=1 Tax=Rhodomicrobium TaxID=1068 RepID=UPI000B4BDF99